MTPASRCVPRGRVTHNLPAGGHSANTLMPLTASIFILDVHQIFHLATKVCRISLGTKFSVHTSLPVRARFGFTSVLVKC